VNYSAKYLIQILENNGYTFRRSKGSHKLYYHPGKNKTVTVPVHGNKDLPKGTFYAILKQAELDTSVLL
jgi:predicted RNA binding protein YcfA (HicA-like mRNA interferase family)